MFAVCACAVCDTLPLWRAGTPLCGAGAAGPSGRPGGPGGLGGRDTWMTDLPPEMEAKPGAMLSQQSVRAFSRHGKVGRGDTAGWTDNPEQRASRQAQQLLQRSEERL